MPYSPLYALFPEVAKAETRTIRSFGSGDLPAGTYGFVELFCNEEGCDCRRVFIHVLCDAEGRSPNDGPIATLAFGWEDESFYRKWAGYPLSELELHELKGPAIISLAPQSKYSPELLAHFEEFLQDKAYVERIIRHYAMYRAAIDARFSKPRARTTEGGVPGKNHSCPCGSGKRYKRCCAGNDATTRDPLQ